HVASAPFVSAEVLATPDSRIRVALSAKGGIAALAGSNIFFWPSGQRGRRLELKLGEPAPDNATQRDLGFLRDDPMIAEGRKVVIWHPETNSPITTLEAPERVRGISGSPDGRFVFAVVADGRLLIRDRQAPARDWI